MFSAASDLPTPPVVLVATECGESAVGNITCPLCGSDRLIKLRIKRATRAGKVRAVYCCASDTHMFLPEIKPQNLTAKSSGTTARRHKGKRRAE